VRRALIAAALLATVALAWGLLRPGPDAPRALESRAADAGGVEVTVVPVLLDGAVAEFDVAFSTHSVELDLDPSGGAVLTVGSATWQPVRWDGDPAGGHHRSGRLTFAAQGPARGAVLLSIGGLPEPVTFTWDLEGP
jgi:hypothetical protein